MANNDRDLILTDAVQYHEGQFPPARLDFEKLFAPATRAVDAIARFDQMLKNMHNSEILVAPLRNQEAVLSSRMEGTISSMDELLEYEADHEDGDIGPDARSEVVETILYQRALMKAQKDMTAGSGINEQLVKDMHKRLLLFGRGATKSPGEFKDEQNYLVDKTKRRALFVPVSPDKLSSHMDRLFEYINTSKHHELIKAAITHVEFEALHPFKDGNGRIGRMLITLMLWEAKLISSPHFYISGYLEEHKNEYIDFMRKVSADNDWNSWCEFFLRAVEAQAVRNLQIAEKINDLHDEMKSVFRRLLASKWCSEALEFVFKNPIFRNSRFTAASGIPASSAAKFSKILLENELLVVVEEASGSRSALYRFEPLMKLVRV